MCPEKSILSAWFDDEVDTKWHDQISRHLENCNKCSEYIQSLEDQSTQLKSAPMPDFEDSLERVKNRIRSKHTVVSSLRFWEKRIPLPAAAAAAVIAAMVTFGTSLFTGNDKNDGLLAGNLSGEGSGSQSIYLPGDKIDEIFSMLESSLNEDFSSNSRVELPSDVNLIFNGDSQLVRSAGFNGSASP